MRQDHFGQQLQMFIPAGAFVSAEAAGTIQFGDGDNYGGRLLEHKVSEAHQSTPESAHPRRGGAPAEGESFYQNVQREGVKRPVEMRHGSIWKSATGGIGQDYPPFLAEGHHRVLVSADIDPKREIPVEHFGPYR